MTARVMIVDDNELYRTAFRRNLELRDYEVYEAENGEEAIAVFQRERPEVVVTDLSMRTPTEGLDVIRSLRQVEPLVPVVMISAVGTFEEGAEASRLGAHSVISKSRIDEEIESLYRTIDSAQETSLRNRALLDEIDAISERSSAEDTPQVTDEDIARLREITSDTNIHPAVRGEAFDTLTTIRSEQERLSVEDQIAETDKRELEEAETRLASIIPAYHSFDESTKKELRTAEYFFQRQGGDKPTDTADFSRNIGFSFCFAVENEAKTRLRKRLNKFLSQKPTIKLIRKLVDPRTNQLDLFYHQYLARLQTMQVFDFTIDNVRQVFQRILEHESRYKPDGLKALGIVVLCFGRVYDVRTMREKLTIANPLNLKGFDKDEDVIRFAWLLVSLQHYRNPYIHPEISEMEKISNIRDTAIATLKEIAKLN